MAADSAVSSRIWPNFELIQDLIVVLITCKNEEDSIKKEIKALEWPQRYNSILTANSIISGRIRSKFELIQAFMHVLNTSKNEEDATKN